MPGRRVDEESYDDLIGERVTALAPSRHDPMRVVVRVGRRSLGAVDRASISELGIAKGVLVDEGLIRRVRSASKQREAHAKALRLLSSRPRSRGKLISDLKRSGFDPALCEATAQRMAEIGLLNDEALAETLAQEFVSRKPAGERFIAGKLRERGFEPSLANEVARRVASERDSAEDALRLAMKKARTMPGTLDRQVIKRRIFGALARRGFDAQTAREAVERALRQLGED